MKKKSNNLVLALAAVLACDPGGGGCDPDGPRGDDPTLRPGTGRSFLLQIRNEDAFDLNRIEVDRSDASPFSGFEAELAAQCGAATGSRFPNNYNGDFLAPADPALDDLVGTTVTCGGAGAAAQQVELCLGYRFLTLAGAVRDWGVVLTTEFSPEDFTSDPARFDAASYLIPIQSASDQATLALVALDHFRRASLIGSLVLDPDACTDPSALDTEVPTGRADEVGGLDDTRVASIGFVVASATQEAMERIDESYAMAREKIEAAARENLADDLDESSAREEMWRGLVDSRLELAGVIGGVPWNLFNPPADGEFEGAIDLIPASAQPAAGLPTCSGVPSDPGSERYRDLIGGLRVDFRDPADDIVASVREEMFESFPTAFEDVDATSMSDEEFVQQLGLEPSGLRAAADDMREMVAVQGRAIETDPDDPDLIVGADREEPPRSSFLVATTLGSGHFEEFDDAYPQHRPTLSYAVRGNANVKDYVGSAMDRALGGIPSLDPNAREVLGALRTQLREQQPLRGQLCVGEPAAGVPSSFRFRLYGVRTTIEKTEAEVQYELWLGERGLECALTGAVAGVPCEDSEWRIGADPIVNTDGAESRLGATYVEWSVATLPDLPSRALEATSRLYLTGREAPNERRRELSGFALSAGDDDDDEFSRCLTLPIGGSVLDDVGDVVATAGTLCSEPAMLCGDFPYDFPLPLEDELTEASTGRDDIESSFARFLRLARVAADEADRLGDQLIAEGLVLDQRAEEARDELETICGGVFNVPDLLPNVTPATCMTPADCAGELDCRDGVCVGSIADLPGLGGDGDPDLESLRRCLGAGTTSSVTLGTSPSCIFRQNGGAPCQCTGPDCPMEAPECPILARDETDCDIVYADLTAAVPSIQAEKTRPLGIVNREDAAVGGGLPPNCLQLARLRQQAFDRDPLAVLRDVVSQSWVYQEPARASARLFGFQADMLGFSTLTLGFRPWATNGSFRSGPAEPTSFPCGPLLTTDLFAELNCGGASPRFGRSLMCGMEPDFDECGANPNQRIQMTQRMGRALAALAGLSGGVEARIQRGGAREDNIDASRLDLSSPAPLWIVNEASMAAGGPVGPDEVGFLRVFDDRNGREGIQCFEFADTSFRDALITAVVPTRELFARVRDDIGMENPNWACTFVEGSTDRYESPFVRDEPETNEVSSASANRIDAFRSLVFEPRYGSAQFNDREDLTAPTVYETLRLVALNSPTADRDTLYGGDEMPDVSEMLYLHPNRPVGSEFQDRLTYGDVMDGLELACLAQEQLAGGTGCDANLDELPRIESADDLVILKQFIECAAAQVEALADRIVLTDVPDDIINDFVAADVGSTFPDNRGLQGETVPEFQAALNAVKTSIRQVASIMRDFTLQLDVIEGALEAKDFEEIADVFETTARAAAALAQCSGANAIGNCLGSAALQVAMSTAALVARMDILDIERQQILSNALFEFADSADTLAQATRNLSDSIAQINVVLARFDRQKEEARRAAARAVGLDRDDVGREYNVNRAMRARLNLTQQRYEAAKTRAVQLAWIARRAVEQRIGMDLSSIDIDMPLVGRPSEWADRICSLQGVNYDELRDPDFPLPEFADTYVGEYVTQLELFIDAYRFTFPFSDGDDTAVLSLRDDLTEVRSQCFVPTPNLLVSTEDLTSVEAEEEGWARACDFAATCGVVSAVDDSPFLTRDAFPSEVGGPTGRHRSAGDASAYVMTFGTPLTGPDDPPPPPGDAMFPGWAQTVDLDAGTYYATWYERLAFPVQLSEVEFDACETECFDECAGDRTCACQRACESRACAAFSATPLFSTEVLPALRGEPGPSVDVSPPMFLDASVDPWVDACRWRRGFAQVDVFEASTARFAVTLDPDALELAPDGGAFAAPMLEIQPTDEAGVASMAPSAYVGTNRDGLLASALCSDDRGERFRTGLVWTRDCDLVCADGFGPTCESGDGRAAERCFRETTFTISLDAIERGELIPSGSLALGNFNYRHLSLGLNVVGTAIRDCSESRTPDTCFSSGFLPFSLRHDTPYRVRNHRGESYDAPLFVGNMEYGKALVAERFLTNPVSSADRTLMQDFVRGEFLGRPLDGQYTLRIWDAEGFDWEKVEDIQILLDYRYWTRFE